MSEGWTRAGSRGTKPFCVRPRIRGSERRRWGRLIRIQEFFGFYCDRCMRMCWTTTLWLHVFRGIHCEGGGLPGLRDAGLTSQQTAARN
eukprot:1522837-Rhodomonas_salina.1